MENLIKLNTLPIGGFGRIIKLTATDKSRRRLLDLGLIPDTIVESIRKSPSGDPIAYEIRGAVIALRSEESSKIMVKHINHC